MGIPLAVPVGEPARPPGASRWRAEKSSLIRVDARELRPNGLPIHGLLAGASGWKVERHEPVARGAVAASFDFAAHDELIAAFPFPHALLFEAELRETKLTITTTVRATG